MLRYATNNFPISRALIEAPDMPVRVSRAARRSAMALRAPVLSALAMTLVLCCGLPSAQAQTELDPWEGYNRWMYNANDGLDRYIVRPVAKGYDAVMPEAGRKGVNNFFKNFYDFNGVLNALLQGRFEQALNNSFRVVANTTVGVFGLFDVASKAGIPRYETDFGHTLHIWGVPRGNYLVLPLLGPSTVRGAAGTAFDAFASPTGQLINDEVFWGLRLFNVIDLRAGLLDAEAVITGDRYVFYRDVYLQNRAALESEGQVKDDFSEFDNDWDEDEF
jgi:phospholipid-binding lipoprotein MlaA